MTTHGFDIIADINAPKAGFYLLKPHTWVCHPAVYDMLLLERSGWLYPYSRRSTVNGFVRYFERKHGRRPSYEAMLAVATRVSL